MVLFTNGNAAPIAGANSSCLPNWILISRSAKNGNAVIFCFRNFKSASVKYGTRNPLRITSLSMTVLTFRIAAAKWERYAFQIALLLGSQVRTDWKNAAKEFPEISPFLRAPLLLKSGVPAFERPWWILPFCQNKKGVWNCHSRRLWLFFLFCFLLMFLFYHSCSDLYCKKRY